MTTWRPARHLEGDHRPSRRAALGRLHDTLAALIDDQPFDGAMVPRRPRPGSDPGRVCAVPQPVDMDGNLTGMQSAIECGLRQQR